MNELAEVFPPGEFLKDELDECGLTQRELAEIIGRPPRLVNEIIKGKKQITPQTAIQLEQALGVPAENWLRLQNQYQLFKARLVEDNAIARRRKLKERFQLPKLIKQGWIVVSERLDVLEQRIRDLFCITSLDAPLVFAHAPRKTAKTSEPDLLQLAWLCRCRQLAQQMKVPKYSPAKLQKALGELSTLRENPQDISRVPAILADCGVRYVVVKPIEGSKIDGACFWLGEEQEQPVVAMTLRLGRIDNFWFVLRHELEHVLRGHGKEAGYLLDQDAGAATAADDPIETVANAAAADFCLNQQALDSYIAAQGASWREASILQLAREQRVHPGLVVGQLQWRRKQYSFLKKHLLSIREIITTTACTDGW